LIAERDAQLLFFTDTPWTPFGAFIASRQFSEALGIEEFGLSDLVRKDYVATFRLGEKLDPQEAGFYFEVLNFGALIFANELSTCLDHQRVYHNQRERQYIYRNDRLAGGKRLVLSANSLCATSSFLPLLSRAFYEVHFFSSTSIGFRYVEEVKPDFVVTEIAQRFVKVIPDDQIDIREFSRQRYDNLVHSRLSSSLL
jgi:alginate O-acetyltransferase complex protein AlgJ